METHFCNAIQANRVGQCCDCHCPPAFDMPDHQVIYLVPGEWDGAPCALWCEDPAPDEEMKVEEAIQYIKTDAIKDIAISFFYDWYNSPGTNTEQGFNDWWERNKKRFGV